jgi:hypothetical protein
VKTAPTIALVFVALWTAACGFMSSPPGPLDHEHHDVARGTATRATVEIGMTAGDLQVTSGAK